MKSVSKDKAVYIYSKDLEPVLRVQPGEMFEVETEDSFTAKFRKPEDWNMETFDWVENNSNPVTGPVYVEGAEPGDAIAVKIHDVECTSVGCVITSRLSYPSPLDWFAEPDGVWGMPIKDGHIIIDEKLRVPIRPLIGCIATAPEREVYLSILEGHYGGNMDCIQIGKGATVVLPVFVKGGLLYMGDCKAIQSDGEIIQPPEVATKITCSVEVRKRSKPLNWPRVEKPEAIMTLASNKPFELAAREAFKEMLEWLEEEYGVERKKAAVLMGMVADARVCQISNTWCTAMCTMPTSYLKATK
ncbi:MAG: acetamidase/formamidase family protein [Chloroflexi bacterium]|nr:acetamidase/formamidase family protein [Chloroflexota bacterium]